MLLLALRRVHASATASPSGQLHHLGECLRLLLLHSRQESRRKCRREKPQRLSSPREGAFLLAPSSCRSRAHGAEHSC